MKNLLLLLATFLSYLTTAQDFNCFQSVKRQYVVTAPSGLNLRAEASLQSEKILSIPNGEDVWSCFDKEQAEVTIDGEKGRWLRSIYKGQEGYLFSPYLEIKKCSDHKGVRIIFPHITIVDDFYIPILCKPFVGIYKMKEKIQGGKSSFIVKPVTLVDTALSYQRFFAARLDETKEKPVFLISGIEMQNKEITGNWMKKMLFPFEVNMFWYQSRGRNAHPLKYLLYAKGEGITNNDNTFHNNPFRQIKNYELWLRVIQKDQISKEQLLYKGDLNAYQEGGYDSGAWVEWVGDLNNDEVPDLIIREAQEKGQEYILFLSNPPGAKQPYQRLSVGGGSCC